MRIAMHLRSIVGATTLLAMLVFIASSTVGSGTAAFSNAAPAIAIPR